VKNTAFGRQDRDLPMRYPRMTWSLITRITFQANARRQEPQPSSFMDGAVSHCRGKKTRPQYHSTTRQATQRMTPPAPTTNPWRL